MPRDTRLAFSEWGAVFPTLCKGRKGWGTRKSKGEGHGEILRYAQDGNEKSRRTSQLCQHGLPTQPGAETRLGESRGQGKPCPYEGDGKSSYPSRLFHVGLLAAAGREGPVAVIRGSSGVRVPMGLTERPENRDPPDSRNRRWGTRKPDTGMVNERICKILCHNLVVLIHETKELGIDVNFEA